MPGGATPHLIQCSDGEYYVAKFAHNMQGPIVLANELLAAQLAELLGLPVPRYAVVEIGPEFIAASPQLALHWGHQKFGCSPGFAFASHYQHLVGDEHPLFLRPLDSLPAALMGFVDNRSDFYGMLVFDKWVCNTDSRQIVYTTLPTPPEFHVHMIDNGFCFNAHRWDFPDAPTRGLCREWFVYEPFCGMDDFKEWLVKLEKKIDLAAIEQCAASIPPEWYGHEVERLHQLVVRLDLRRMKTEELVEDTVRAIGPRLLRNHSRRWLPKRESSREGCLERGGATHTFDRNRVAALGLQR